MQDLQNRIKQIESSLLASETRVKTLIRLIPDGLLITDTVGKIEAANPHFLSLFRCGYADIIGRNFKSYFESPRNARHAEAWALNETAEAVEIVAIRQDGSEFPAKVQIMSFSTDLDKQLLVFIEDVTREHDLEQLKREFMAMLTHDIRTPITSILSTFELLEIGLLGQLNDRGMRSAAGVRQTCKQVIRLLNDLLDLEKIQSGKFELEIKEIHLNDSINSAVEIVKPIAEARNITLSVESADLNCAADCDRITQVITNLLSNAIKYSPNDAKIKIFGEYAENDCKISIIDEGRGIPEDKLGKVFSKFEQVDITDAKSKGGIGLGLAICQAIVEEHGGTVGVSSKLGEGSCFWFKLPQKARFHLKDKSINQGGTSPEGNGR